MLQELKLQRAETLNVTRVNRLCCFNTFNTILPVLQYIRMYSACAGKWNSVNRSFLSSSDSHKGSRQWCKYVQMCCWNSSPVFPLILLLRSLKKYEAPWMHRSKLSPSSGTRTTRNLGWEWLGPLRCAPGENEWKGAAMGRNEFCQRKETLGNTGTVCALGPLLAVLL